MIRKIVEIDEERCDGCGQCIPACAEGAIALVGGKARLSSDVLCDGLGACLGECPRGAIRVVEREALAFDEAAVRARLARPAASSAAGGRRLAVVADAPGGVAAACPGSRAMALPRRGLPAMAAAGSPARDPAGPAGQSRLGHWPVQLHLVPPSAPWLRSADLLVAADCVPFAYARFHDDFLDGRAVVIGCPKLDDVRAYVDKLGDIFSANDVRRVTVVRMEVPCCGGISMAVRRALAASGRTIPLRDVVVGVDGAIRP